MQQSKHAGVFTFHLKIDQSNHCLMFNVWPKLFQAVLWNLIFAIFESRCSTLSSADLEKSIHASISRRDC